MGQLPCGTLKIKPATFAPVTLKSQTQTQNSSQIMNSDLREASSRLLPRERGKQRFPRSAAPRGLTLHTQASGLRPKFKNEGQEQKAKSGSYPGWVPHARPAQA